MYQGAGRMAALEWLQRGTPHPLQAGLCSESVWLSAWEQFGVGLGKSRIMTADCTIFGGSNALLHLFQGLE